MGVLILITYNIVSGYNNVFFGGLVKPLFCVPQDRLKVGHLEGGIARILPQLV